MKLQEAIQKIRTETGSLNISLRSNNIGDKEASEIAGAIKLTKLSQLDIDLSFNNIGDRGASEIAGAIKLIKLFQLNIALCSNKIGDKGAKAISQSMTKTKLFSLGVWLRNNNIKSEELKASIAVACKNVNSRNRAKQKETHQKKLSESESGQQIKQLNRG